MIKPFVSLFSFLVAVWSEADKIIKKPHVQIFYNAIYRECHALTVYLV